MKVDMWHDVGHTPNLKLKLGRKEELGQKEPIFPSLTERVKEERKRRAKSILLRSIKFCWSVFVRPRTKVHCIDEGYAWVPLIPVFRKVPTRVSTLQEVGNSSYLVYFPSLGRENRVFR